MRLNNGLPATGSRAFLGNEMKSYGMQATVGFWLALGIYFGLMQKSWDTFFGFGSVALFFLGIALAGAALKSKRKPLRVIGLIANLAFLAVFIGFVLNSVERLYLQHGSSYPSFLAQDLGSVDSKRMEEIRAKDCPKSAIQIFRKGDPQNEAGSYWVIRCGNSYYEGHTYISHTHPFADLTPQGSKDE